MAGVIQVQTWNYILSTHIPTSKIGVLNQISYYSQVPL